MPLAEDFAQRGWAVVRGVVPAGELAAMLEVFEGIVPERLPYPRRPDGVMWEEAGASRRVPALAAIARDPRFAAIVAEALGAAAVQLLQDTLLFKPKRRGAPVEWHQDHTYVGFLTPARVATLRLALVDEDEASGCMRVVDGSHRWGPVGGVRALTEAQVDSLLPSLSAEQSAAIEGATPLPLAPGDVSLHHCLTLHGSGPNGSERPRKTIILRMFDAECRLDPTRLPPGGEATFAADADGRLAESLFPRVFPR
jgi:ectoine hydroxylase-related dioxygenase (phytanoyl-CoA dioxygenase family)